MLGRCPDLNYFIKPFTKIMKGKNMEKIDKRFDSGGLKRIKKF